MKTIKHIEIKNGDEVIVDAQSGRKLNTANLILICLEQSKYGSTGEQWQAYEISKKLTDGKDVELEEAEYEVVKKKVDEFEPYRNGFTFMPFLELFK